MSRSRLICFSILVLFSTTIFAAQVERTDKKVPNEVLIKVREGASEKDVEALEKLLDADKAKKLTKLKSGTLMRVRSRSKNTDALIKALEKHPQIEFAEPNYLLQLSAVPNDPAYAQLWGLKNTGQIISSTPGSAGADIDAEAAWNVTKGSASVVVAVVDTGVDYTHPDLAANMWTNPGGKGNAACAAGTFGFNAITGTCDPKDDEGHGTHVAGTIGAVGNNGVGVAGVNWTASIMALKFLDYDGYGNTADAIEAIDFAIQAKIDGVNVRVLSNSWGGGSFSKALLDVINKANEHDILFVASAGNNGASNDSSPQFPAGYTTANMIAVAATDNRDQLAWFSNYGPTTVHLAAPGVSVFSTTHYNGYEFLSGTSMAAPHVSGVAALVLAASPSLTTAQVKSAILNNTDPLPSLTGRCVTGGRLNAAKAVGGTPTPDFSIGITPASRVVGRGGTTSYALTINAQNGFAGAVDLTVSGLPAGATASITPSTATTTAALVVTTGSTTPLSTVSLSITGTSGAMTRSVTATLTTITAQTASPCPSFSLGYGPSITEPAAFAIADLNGDGKSDYAVADAVSNAVLIRYGRTFSASSSYVVGRAPVGIAAADLNGDGRLDLVTANSLADNVSVLLANGSGGFNAAAHYGAGASPFAVTAGDFNRDGAIDLATANNGSASVSILLGQGNGTFGAATQFAAGASPFGITAADVDADGSLDLAVANFGANTVSLLGGNGDGTFDAPLAAAAGTKPSSVAAADFDRDGKIDLAVSNYGSSNVSLLSGNGDGTFDAPVHHAVGSNPNSVAAGDLDGDGKLDLVTANEGSENISVLLANAGGSFNPALSLNAISTTTHAVIGDLNDDGRPDILAGSSYYSYYYPSVLYFTNLGSCSLNCGNLANATDSSVGGTPDSVASGDFNRDGKLDLAIADNASNHVAIRLGNGDGTFAAGVSAAAGTSPRGLTAADFNRDGKLDLAVASSGSNQIAILIGNGDGSFQTAVPYAAGTNPRAVAAADFNHDGKLDLAVAAHDDDAVAILRGNGDGTFQAAVTYAAGDAPRAITVGDFNRDGWTDVATANASSDNLSILLGLANGTLQDAVNVAAGDAPRAIVAGDLNSDGNTDLAVANFDSNDVSFLAGNGNGTFRNAVSHAAGTGPSAVIAVDLNVDGRLDLVTANATSHDASLLLGGDSSFGAPANHPTGLGPASLAGGDFNRDGKTDLVSANSGGASFSLLLNACPLPDLAVTKTHSGTFTQAATGNYTITVSNTGALATNAPVTVKDTLPAGLTATAMSGTGWTCVLSTTTCTRIDALAAGASYPPITLTVRIQVNSALSVTNNVTVSGGGELYTANSTASDPTTITPATDLVLIKTHAGAFVRGGSGRTYSLVVRNVGGLASSGTVTVTDTLPASLTATAMTGSGWSCNTGSRTCTRNDALASNSAYPAITLTVSVAANAPSQVINTATVSGGGDVSSANNTAADPTQIWSASACSGFGSPMYYGSSSGGGARLAVGDFNSDGHSDVATATSSNLSIFLGSGNGTLPAPVNYPARPIGALAAGDLDRDGDLDLVASTSESDAQVTVFIGQGNGTFAAAVHYDAGTASYLYDVAVADLDRDGNLDVVAMSTYSSPDALLVFRGNGDGTLRAPESIDPGSNYTTAWTLSDVNGDTIADVVFAASDTVMVKPGNGDGTFGAAISSPLLTSVSSLTAADFNGDGIQDLAGTSYDDAVILLGNGNATFAAGVLYPIGWSSSYITTADLNADGKVDLVTGGYNISTLLGNGDGTFQSAAIYYGDSYRVAVTDLNSDGSPDLVYTTYYQIGVRLTGCADVTITKSHYNNFRGGRTGSYRIRVLNVGAGTATGTITVTDNLPEGMTISSYSTYGMDCSTSTATRLTCTRTGSLSPNSYLDIDLYVLVSPAAPTSVTNVATVSGGGDTNTANNSASDPTTIVHAPDLVITQSHTGTVWTPGGTGTFTISVGNVGSKATSGTVTVTDSLSSGFSRVSMSGPGWNCVNLTCTRSDALDPTSVYPPITLTVTVLSGYSYNNSAYVSGGGEDGSDTYNNYSTDSARVLTAPQSVVASAASASQITVTWYVPYYYGSPAPLYEVFRSAANGPYVLIGSTLGGAFYDASVSPGTAYLYKVRAVENSVLGPFSTPDYAGTFVFADDPVVAQSTIIQRVHVEQLRYAVNVLRAAAGLPGVTVTDASLVGMPAKKVHVTELRTAINEVRAYLGMTPFVYSDSNTISAVHINQLRGSLR